LGFASPIALKVLKLPESWTLERKQARVASFQREGRMLFELSARHPSIVRAFETGTIGSRDGSPAPYLALEWLDGASLDCEAKLRRKRGHGPMSLPQVLELLHGPAEALALAHARGVVHRDVKPGNLFASLKDGELSVKILDFGVAKLVDEGADTTAQHALTAGATASFTAMYAAPEQWLERLGATGAWTDVHALALVCVELLSGNIPFSGRESAQFMAACLDPTVRPTPAARGVELAEEVESVFARAVALEPRQRFRDVGSFWSALREAARVSPERCRVELVSFQTDAGAAESLPDDVAPLRTGELLRPATPSTTAATASLPRRATPEPRSPSISKWLPRAGLVVAIAAAGGYVASDVGNSASIESSPRAFGQPDTRLVSSSEPEEPAHHVYVPPRPVPASYEPRVHPPVPSARASAGKQHAPTHVASNVVSIATAPAASTEPPQPMSRTSAEPPAQGPDYDDPALTRRR
ncbi:MAG TPA: serine/threonine-protein kinase, partial [Polyangiaceae bacterium]